MHIHMYHVHGCNICMILNMCAHAPRLRSTLTCHRSRVTSRAIMLTLTCHATRYHAHTHVSHHAHAHTLTSMLTPHADAHVSRHVLKSMLTLHIARSRLMFTLTCHATRYHADAHVSRSRTHVPHAEIRCVIHMYVYTYARIHICVYTYIKVVNAHVARPYSMCPPDMSRRTLTSLTPIFHVPTRAVILELPLMWIVCIYAYVYMYVYVYIYVYIYIYMV